MYNIGAKVSSLTISQLFSASIIVGSIKLPGLFIILPPVTILPPDDKEFLIASLYLLPVYFLRLSNYLNTRDRL